MNELNFHNITEEQRVIHTIQSLKEDDVDFLGRITRNGIDLEIMAIDHNVVDSYGDTDSYVIFNTPLGYYKARTDQGSYGNFGIDEVTKTEPFEKTISGWT